MLTPLSPLAIAHAFLENEKEGFVLYMCTLCENFEVSLKAKKQSILPEIILIA